MLEPQWFVDVLQVLGVSFEKGNAGVRSMNEGIMKELCKGGLWDVVMCENFGIELKMDTSLRGC